MSLWYCPIQITWVRNEGDTEGGFHLIEPNIPDSYLRGGKAWTREKILGFHLLVELIDEPTGQENGQLNSAGCVNQASGKPPPGSDIPFKDLELEII